MVNHRLPYAGCDMRDRSMVFRFNNVKDCDDFPCHGCQCQEVDTNVFCHEWIDYKKLDEDCQRHNHMIDEQERWAGLRQAQLQQKRQSEMDSHLQPRLLPEDHVQSRRPQSSSSYADGTWPCHDDLPAPEGTCPMPNSRPLSCQCAFNRLGRNDLCPHHPGEALEGLTYSHRRCPDAKNLHCRDSNKLLVGPGHLDMLDARRPSGNPYFTHGKQKSCLPSQAPLAGPSQFTFDQWLATTASRRPPSALASTCVPSVCTLCGPRYETCCQNYSNPDAYLLSKLGN